MKIFMATKFPSKTEVSIVACLLENHLSRAVFEMMKTFNETSLFFLLIGGYQHNHVLKLPFPFPQRRLGKQPPLILHNIHWWKFNLWSWYYFVQQCGRGKVPPGIHLWIGKPTNFYFGWEITSLFKSTTWSFFLWSLAFPAPILYPPTHPTKKYHHLENYFVGVAVKKKDNLSIPWQTCPIYPWINSKNFFSTSRNVVVDTYSSFLPPIINYTDPVSSSY